MTALVIPHFFDLSFSKGIGDPSSRSTGSQSWKEILFSRICRALQYDYVPFLDQNPHLLFSTHASPSQPTVLHTHMPPGGEGNGGLTPAHRSVDTQKLLHTIFLPRIFDARSYAFPRNFIGGFRRRRPR